MPKFKVFAEESHSFECTVEADSLAEAIDKVEQNPEIYCPSEMGDYIDGSFQVNRTLTEDVNNVANL